MDVKAELEKASIVSTILLKAGLNDTLHYRLSHRHFNKKRRVN